MIKCSKHRLFIKLITSMDYQLRDKSIKLNYMFANFFHELTWPNICFLEEFSSYLRIQQIIQNSILLFRWNSQVRSSTIEKTQFHPELYENGHSGQKTFAPGSVSSWSNIESAN